ncbi:hypothetical protein IFM89_018771 [Coptis chinensis]|uniref:KIB1-4 beta-propeller domain-containing protein n=1 Tax=Coptis chinensis TaxID=261450 RepID=A0A835I3F8_9MAGN|nr:hypothetical protein IFM89_018771 [Coptis chinensis]
MINFEDAVYYNDKFYATDEAGALLSCDTSGAEPKVKYYALAPLCGLNISTPPHTMTYVLESAGELLCVRRIVGDKSTVEFQIFKLQTLGRSEKFMLTFTVLG